jgi:NAD+ kinase
MQAFAELQRDDVVVIRRSADSSRFLHPPGYSYYATLRSKLNWHEMPNLKPGR